MVSLAGARSCFLVLAGLAVAAGTIAPAGAAEGGGDFAGRLVGRTAGEGKASACFIRTYDAAHLASHRGQKVAAMMVLVSAEPAGATMGPAFSFSLGVKLRASGTRWEAGGACGGATPGGDGSGRIDRLTCGVDCDGGGIEIRLADDATAVVTIDHYMRVSKSGDDAVQKSLSAGAEDRSFRLQRTKLGDCALLIQSDKVASLEAAPR
jgi:hypothetical protein